MQLKAPSVCGAVALVWVAKVLALASGHAAPVATLLQQRAAVEPENEDHPKPDDESNSEHDSVQAEDELEPTSPPPMPFAHMYEEAGEIAQDIEVRSGPNFFPEGTHPDVDMDSNEKHDMADIFSQDVNVFGHCILIRDYAEPLRVGSGLVRQRTVLSQERHQQHHPPAHGARSLRGGAFANATRMELDSVRVLAQRQNGKGSDDKDEDGEKSEDKGKDDKAEERKLPSDGFILQGSVADKDQSSAELTVNMFAWLRSIAGEVRVIPNGAIAKWSSKRKVPIAGYLCTDADGPVLHTLPTPCVPTAVTDEGEPQPPPADDDDAGDSGREEDAERMSVEGAPNWDLKGDVHQGKATQGNSLLLQRVNNSFREAPSTWTIGEGAMDVGVNSLVAQAPSPASQPTPPAKESPETDESPEMLGDEDKDQIYKVWVGGTKLSFSSKPRADQFCRHYAEKIASDLGDTEWVTEDIPEVVEKDVSVGSFVQMTRRQSASWTTGMKSLLVVVMDWKRGDNSRAPYSRQTKSPAHYENTIFPRVRQAFKTMSGGRFDIDVTVLPEVIRYTRPRSRYVSGGYPFPGLYNGAKTSLEGNPYFGNSYRFDNYDLVFVISPQQAPTGTKGVAWVGAKGAMCNGCEAISDNFQVMVAVHELGHNLGLWHASSKSLEYGNVFDWMGNYPDVTGLSYGLGYKLKLHWTPMAAVRRISDRDLSNLNDEFVIAPFDENDNPKEGQILGIHITLKDLPRDLYISFRKSIGSDAGVFITQQDKDKPNSELVDLACHSPSMRDARMRTGWTYMDPSLSVIVRLLKVTDKAATLHLYRAPKSQKKLAAIRARKGFSDGNWKCPRTCTDSDLLVAMYGNCQKLAQEGYCRGGSITMSGGTYSIGKDLCPVACGTCEEIMDGPTLKAGGCADRNIKISGMSCHTVARSGYCDYTTNLGHVGNDLCPRSCDRCPPRPDTSGAVMNGYEDPAPDRQHGTEDTGILAPPIAEEEDQAAERKEEEEERKAEDDAETDAKKKDKEEEEKEEESTCTDDPVWTDADGDGCKVYNSYIEKGQLSREDACSYAGGSAKIYCRKTCKECKHTSETCEDKQCIHKWHTEKGQCFACADWPKMCTQDFFRADCPKTCGVCKPMSGPSTSLPLTTLKPQPTTTTTTTTMAPPTPPPVCKDHECVDEWVKKFGKCYKCRDFAEDYCGRDEAFMASCPRACKVCEPQEKNKCQDHFREHTCKRYVKWDWCGIKHISDNCPMSCGICAQQQLAGEMSMRERVPERSTAFTRAGPVSFAAAVALLASVVVFFA